MLQKLLTARECELIAALYSKEQHFRSHIMMARHGFGKAEYRYFKYPLPELIAALRTTLYSRWAPIANQWSERMGEETRYPAKHSEFLKQCHDHGQLRPTPLLLRYLPGEYNCLHQDLYGDLAFPIQVTILLSEPGTDFTGGSLFWRNSARVCRPELTSCHWRKVTLLPSLSIIDRFKVPGEHIE